MTRKDLLSTLICLSLCFAGFAQIGRYSSVDFDKDTIKLKYMISHEKTITDVSLFKINGTGCFKNIYSKSCRKKMGLRLDKVFPLKLMGIQTGDTVSVQLPQLPPNSSFLVTITTDTIMNGTYDVLQRLNVIDTENGGESAKIFFRTRDSLRNKMIELQTQLGNCKRSQRSQLDRSKDSVTNMLNRQDTIRYKDARKKYDSIVAANISIPPYRSDFTRCNLCTSDTFYIATFYSFIDFYEDSLWRNSTANQFFNRQAQLTLSVNNTDSIIHAFALCPFNFQNCDMGVYCFIKYSQECLHCKDTMWGYQGLNRTNTNTITTFTRLVSLDTGEQRQVLTGISELDSVNNVIIPAIPTADKRVQNLFNSLQEIDYIKQLLRFYEMKNEIPKTARASYSNLKAILDSIYRCLDGNYIKLKTNNDNTLGLKKNIQNMTKAINGKIVSWGGFNIPAQYNSATTIVDKFDTRTGYTLLADFGFMSYYDPQQLKGNERGLRNVTNGITFSGFIGFHVNFRPYNTDIAFRHVENKRRPWDYLSFTSGILLASLAADGKRDGFIGKASIYTGLGYAFGNAIRLTAGGVWYRKIDPNPLISRKTVAVTPYLGLSLDARLKVISDAYKAIFQP